MTDPVPGHVLASRIERSVFVHRCSCGQFSYAGRITDQARLDAFFAQHVKESTA